MTDITNLDRDAKSRNSIVFEIKKNFFVEAGAGSGKTTMLVNRMVAMVEAGIEIDKMCAITFTKAAAGEFYKRFQKLLQERSNPTFVCTDKGQAGQLPQPTEETRARCLRALQNIDLCFMGTIDSFCNVILSEHPTEAGVPSDAGLVSDKEAEDYYKQQYVKIANGEYGKELQEQAKNFSTLHEYAQEVFAKGMAVLMSNRNVDFKNIAVDETLEQDILEVREVVEILRDNTQLKYTQTKKKENIAAWGQIDYICHTLSGSLASNFSNTEKVIKKQVAFLRIVPEAMSDYGPMIGKLFEPCGRRSKWLELSKSKKETILFKFTNNRYAKTMVFLKKCVPVLEKNMRTKGILTYFDYLYYLREMLRKDAKKGCELIKYIGRRHRYFLLDEFQDTNPMQAEVFFYLASDNPKANWYECQPRPGSLFIVGDPKQSIYRFRGADVTSFLRVKDLFKGNVGEVLSLLRNFRSTRTLCEFFNRCFTNMLPKETEEQSKFEEIPPPQIETGEFSRVYTYTALNSDAEGAGAVQIGEIIATLVDNDKYLIKTGDEGLRKICFGDIMVITKKKDNLLPVMNYLRERNIPTRVEGKVPFGECEALVEIYRIYSAVADSSDNISLYGALTGQLIGLSPQALLKYVDNGGEIGMYSEINEEAGTSNPLVVQRLKELQTLNGKATWLSPGALFVKIMEDYRVYKRVSAEKLENVYYALELLRDAEKSGIVVTLQDGAAFLQELLEGNSDRERCLSLKTERDAVHLANLHKVKGLEAPVVILADAEEFTGEPDVRIINSKSEGYIFKIKGDNYKIFFETQSFSEEQDKEKQTDKAEQDRLVYVAATRARNVLIINNEANLWDPIKENGLPDFFESISRDREMAAVEQEQADAKALYEEAEASCVLNNRHMEDATYAMDNPSRLRLKSKLSDEQEEGQISDYELDAGVNEQTVNDSQNMVGGHPFPAVLGTMIHRLMEILVSSKNKVEVTETVNEIIREYRTVYNEPHEETLTKLLLGVAQKMRTGGYAQTNGLPQDMLDTLLSADEVYCEVPFSYKDDTESVQKLWSGVMDVVYRQGEQWHIVDYKTNADGNDLDNKYRNQLDAYIKAFKATTGETADARTYHIEV